MSTARRSPRCTRSSAIRCSDWTRRTGEFFSIDEDDQTAMASTTKIWAFDVTVHALDDGCVTLDDEVTINAFEAGVGGKLDAGRQHGPARNGRGRPTRGP